MLNLKIISSFFLLFFLSNSGCNRTEGQMQTDDAPITTPHQESDTEETVAEIEEESKPIVVGAAQPSEFMPLIQGKKVALLVNQTSMIGETHLVDRLTSVGVDIKTIFAPEHGFRGKADAGAHIKDGIDVKTGIPLISLHGSRKKPTTADLAGLDYVIFDIQDVGARFYTYISSMSYVMEACAENNVKFLVLDRPNPNGHYVDGPILNSDYSSFIGLHEIPVVHGMTVGEYAEMVNGEGWLKDNLTCDITIIELKNYTHISSYQLPIRPSPNLPNDQSIKLYPSLGLFEGTTINAGRGTEFQFQRYGSPNLDNKHYNFNYTPIANFGAKYPKHQNKVCYGADLSTIDAERSFTLIYIMDAYKHAKDKAKFFNTSNFTKHAGTKKLQQQIEAGKTEAEIKQSWSEGLTEYKKMRTKYLIYKD